MRTGDPIGIRYLPYQPDTSDDHPEPWIAKELASQKLGYLLVSSGIAFSCLTGCLDWRRRRAMGLVPELEGERKYGMNSIVSVFGVAFFISGVFIQIESVRQLLSGREIVMIANGVPEAAGPTTRFFMLRFPIPFWAIGALALRYAKTYQILTSPTGVVAREPFGKTWQAKWDELQVIKRRQGTLQISSRKHKA